MHDFKFHNGLQCTSSIASLSLYKDVLVSSGVDEKQIKFEGHGPTREYSLSN